MKKYIFLNVIASFVIFIASLLAIICKWSTVAFNVSFYELVYTITSPIKGTAKSTVTGALIYCLPRVFVVLLLLIAINIFVGRLINKKNESRTPDKVFALRNISYTMLFVVVAVASVYGAWSYVNLTYDVSAFVDSMGQTSTVFEQYYISPKDVNITSPEKKKNLIFICMESMENSYASTDVGGGQDINYMPNLTNLACENISFSDTELLGGANHFSTSSWTMSALLGITSGTPYLFSYDEDEASKADSFSNGLITLGDILKDEGYNQEFICGSDASFGGRKVYFEEHGDYEICDYYSAKGKYIEDSHYVWWGYEDKYLYKAAKGEITELAKKGEPFNVTLLTVDTHADGGFICDKCEIFECDEQLSMVVKCADKQINDFLKWCRKQPFYDDTVIVISGDHRRMDTCLVHRAENRKIYNCFINTGIDKDNLNLLNRNFTTLDLFPTTLAALGFTVEGDRLGFGTNLFSDKETLTELLGYSYLNEELAKQSQYFDNYFIDDTLSENE